VTNSLSAADKVMWITWKNAEEQKNMPVLRYTNEVIDAYVATAVYLKLYSYMYGLKERAIYCDSNCVIFHTEVWQPPASTCGDKFGDMTNLLGPNEYIKQFVSGGPKNQRTES
jgi:hypothetical protein